MEIEFTTYPETEDIDFVTRKINEYIAKPKAISKFGFFIRNKNKEMIAGCNGVIYAESFPLIYTNQL